MTNDMQIFSVYQIAVESISDTKLEPHHATRQWRFSIDPLCDTPFWYSIVSKRNH